MDLETVRTRGRPVDDPSTSSVSYTIDNTDCDDIRDDVNPAAQEICDVSDTDEDCDGLSDDADSDALLSTKTTTMWTRIRMDSAKKVWVRRIAMTPPLHPTGGR